MIEQLTKEILAFESDYIWVHENFMEDKDDTESS
jgi:hypothetical protein